MLQQFTSYLVQFNRVTIPSIGTFELITHPAQLDVVNQLVQPPFYETGFSTNDEVSQHQLQYFGAALAKDEEGIQTVFKEFGHHLKNKLETEDYQWNGIGTLQYNQGEGLVFIPVHTAPVLPTVKGERVIRQNAQHQVLVGDQMVYSDETAESINDTKPRKDVFIIIAWIMTALAFLFILFYLYQHHFAAGATGLQQKIKAPVQAPSYK